MFDKCYKFKKNIYNDGILNNGIDCTYILHLVNNGRMNNIKNQLINYHPSNIVYIVFNKGYKKCFKGINNSITDNLVSFIKIFEHAKSMNYNNILILEDDFMFSDKIKDQNHIKNINNFLIKHKNDKFTYALGCIPLIQIPYNFNSSLVPLFGCIHSTIFSKKMYIELIDKYYNNKINYQLDMHICFNYYKYNYMYNIPLCYQIFPNTECYKNWGKKKDGSISLFNTIFFTISKYLIKLLKLDKQYEPGFSICYFFSKILLYLLILIFISCLYYIYLAKRSLSLL